MEHEKKNDEHIGSSNGFILGLILGVAITLLFTTKKGRKLLKLLMDEGADKVARLEEVLQKKEQVIEDDLDEIISGTDYVEKHQPVTDEPKEKESVIASQKDEVSTFKETPRHKPPEQDIEEKKHSVRRFFKGAKRN